MERPIQEISRFYEILVNGNSLGTLGHKSIFQFYLNFTVDDKRAYLSPVIEYFEDGQKYHARYEEQVVSLTEDVEIVPVERQGSRQFPIEEVKLKECS